MRQFAQLAGVVLACECVVALICLKLIDAAFECGHIELAIDGEGFGQELDGFVGIAQLIRHGDDWAKYGLCAAVTGGQLCGDLLLILLALPDDAAQHIAGQLKGDD